MGSKIVQARSIRGNDVVLASTAAELLTLLAFYQGTSVSDPNYLVGVTIQLLPIDYTFTQAELPLLVRGGMSLRGTGVGQTRLISAQTTSVGAKPIVSCLLPYGGRAYNVNLSGFSIVGDAYATAGIYVKGLQTSTIEYIQITNMGATGSIGVQIDAAVTFGVYYNTIQSVEVGWGASSGSTIGFRLKTIDYPAQLRRANSNNLIMCSAKYNVDAAYELDGCIGITMTACEAEVNSVGLRILNCASTVVSGGYFENNTSSDIQLGELSGASQSSVQTCLLNPYLISTTRLSGISRGSTGDVYLLSNSGSPPGATLYDRTWLEKAHIKNLSSSYIEHWAYATATKVGYYRFSGDANYRLTISNDGNMEWGSGAGAADVSLFRTQADVLALATNDSFRINGTGYLIWSSGSGVAADVLMSRMSADILGLANNDSWQVNGTGKMLWSTASGTTADTGLERLTATTNGTLSAINLCDVRVVGAFNNGRLRLGNYYLYVDASANLRMSVGEPASDGAGTNISSVGAPTGSSYVTLGNDATLSAERVLTGTASQVVITDNGAGSTVVLSLPQSIATTSSPTFAAMTLGAASTTQGSLVLYGTGGANAHTLRAATTPAAANTYIWPSADPGASTVLTASAPSAGVVTMSWSATGTGSVETDAIWDAAGDLAVGTGANTAAKLGIGTGLQVLRVNAGATALEWSTVASTGDMILASAQTNTAAKTFNATTLLLRNVADTFNGSFTNTNTADRVYTLPDVTDTLVTLTSTQTMTNKTINGVTITAPASSATLTLVTGSSLITAGAFAVTLTSTATTNVTLPTTGTLATLAGTETLTNKTITATAKATYGAIVKVPITYTPAAAGTATLDCSLGDTHRITMPAGNITIALANITNGQMIQIAITQPSVGSRLVTWFTTIRWANRTTPPVLTVTALKRDVFGIMCTGAGTYDGYIIGQNI